MDLSFDMEIMLLLEVRDKYEWEEQLIIDNYVKGNHIGNKEQCRLQSLTKAMYDEINKGNGHWWLSPYPEERAYRQHNCSTMILDDKDFYMASKILKTTCCTYEQAYAKWREKRKK